MNVLKKVFPLAGIILIAVLTIFFRSIPKGKSWDNYKVLYVNSSSINSSLNVDQILSKNGVLDFVSLSGQHAPIMLAKNSIEEAMLKLSIAGKSPENSYLYDRQKYFYDSKGQYQLYYIPELYESALKDALAELEKEGCRAGVDSTLAYLWLLPCLIIALAFILLIFCKNKLFFALSAILPCIYVACNAFYACAIAVSILLLTLFFIANIYGRKGAVKKVLLQNILIPLSLVISIVTAFSASLLSGFFFILLLAGSFCAILTAINIKNHNSSKYSFTPVFIRRASSVSIYGGKFNFVMPVMLIAAVIIIAYFALGSLQLVSSKSKSKIKLPGKSSEQDASLPDFEAFYRWNWNVLTAPYKSLNENDENDENHLVYPRFVIKDGLISEEKMTLYYDQDFKQKLYDQIDLFDFNSIESVIKAQGDDFSAGYTDSASYNVSLFGIIMLIMCFTMLLFIYFSAIIGKGGRK